jgi:hypothetical protein
MAHWFGVFSMSSVPTRLCISPRKATWIARSSVPPNSFGPTSRGRSSYWKRFGDTGQSCLPSNSARSVFCTFPPMKSTALSPRLLQPSPKRRPMRPTVHIQLQRHLRIIWCVPTTTPTDFLCSPPIAPTTTVHASFPEKLIPLVILNALKGAPLPVYGDGQNVRDWLYVEDHCDGHSHCAGSRRSGADLQYRRKTGDVGISMWCGKFAPFWMS